MAGTPTDIYWIATGLTPSSQFLFDYGSVTDTYTSSPEGDYSASFSTGNFGAGTYPVNIVDASGAGASVTLTVTPAPGGGGGLTITLTPTSIQAGSGASVTWKATGLTADTSGSLSFGRSGAAPNWTDAIKADGSGNASGTFTTGQDAPGSYVATVADLTTFTTETADLTLT